MVPEQLPFRRNDRYFKCCVLNTLMCQSESPALYYTFYDCEITLSMTVAKCCVQVRDWKSSIHNREETE